MGLRLITAPFTTPVSLAETKQHLRQDASDQDTLIATYIAAATDYAESFMGRALVDQTWELVLDTFPTAEIKIPKPPLIEVVSINYFDAGGLPAIVAASDYFVDTASEPGWVVPQGGSTTWPATLDAINSVSIRYRAGYIDGSSSPPTGIIPDAIRAAILLTIGAFYENREQIIIGNPVAQLPWGAEQLLRRYRVETSMA